MICWHRQNVSCVQIVSVHHSGDVTAMFAPDLHFFDLYPLFRVSKRGSPSKNLEPRKILGLPNPHRARRRGAVPFRRRGRTGRRQAGPVPGRRLAVPRAAAGRRGGEGRGQGGSLAIGYTAKAICRSGKESDPSGGGLRWVVFGCWRGDLLRQVGGRAGGVRCR